MGNRRRGTRTRRPADSELNTPLNNGTPADTDDSGSDDAGNQNSERGQQDNGNENTRNDGSSADEFSGGTTSRTNDADAEDAAEWQKIQEDLANERKRRTDAQRKITEQGNENKSLIESNADLQNQVRNLTSQVAELLAGGNGSDRSTDLFGGGASDNGEGDSELHQEVRMLRGIVEKYMGNVNDVATRFDSFQEEQTYESDITALQERFGVNREAAQTMIEAFDLGNVVAFAQAFEMSSLPREARENLREERQRRRTSAAVGHPGVSNSSYTPTNTDDAAGREEEATRILNIRGDKARRQAIEQALEKDPGIFEFLRQGIAEASGFNL